MVRQARLMAVAGAFVIECAVLLVVGSSGAQGEASQEEASQEKQGHNP